MATTSMLEKVGLLLNQAEHASTPEEAAAFTKKAQGLASQNAIDLARARQAIAKREERETPTSRTVSFGDLGTRSLKMHLVNLYSAVAGANDVTINIRHDSTGVIPYGMPSDLEMSDLLFGSLATQMVEASNAYMAKGEYKGETEYRSKRIANPDYERGWYGEPKTIEVQGHFPVDGRTARASFYRGFISEISTRLRTARSEAIANDKAVRENERQQVIQERVERIATDLGYDSVTAIAEQFDMAAGTTEADQVRLMAAEFDVKVEESTGAELVLASKVEEVRDYYKTHSNARGSWKGSQAGSHRGSSAAGRTAGRNARISGQRAIGGARTGISA